MSNRRLPIFMASLAAMLVGSVLVQSRAAQDPVGASTVGNDTCVTCHEDIGKSFAAAAHGRGQASCESCHGPGSTHAAEATKETIRNPETLPAVDANETCLSCHNGRAVQHWQTSRHAAVDVKCTSCHDVHGKWTADHALRAKTTNDQCLTCHESQRRHFLQRSAHPLKEGKMSCTSCHNPHGSAGEGSMVQVTVNDTCNTCHMDKQGPFLWEHAPVREDCMSCHAPHGSNNPMLLNAPTTRLCQSCHLLGHHQTVASQAGQIWVQNRACVNCHLQIHGSNHPSGIVFLR